MKKAIIIIVSIVVALIVIFGGVFILAKVFAPDIISSNNYSNPLDNNDNIDLDKYITYTVGEDIDPGLYSLDVKSSAGALLGLDSLSSINLDGTPYVATLHKSKLNYDFTVSLVEGNTYNNIYLEDGDWVKLYDIEGIKTVLELNKQEALIQYDPDNVQAGFYLVGTNMNSDSERASFSTSSNVLFRKKGNTYKPRAFFPVDKLEKKVKLNDGDIVFIESTSLLNSDIKYKDDTDE